MNENLWWLCGCVFAEDNGTKHETFQYTKEFFDKISASREFSKTFRSRSAHICLPDFHIFDFDVSDI